MTKTPLRSAFLLMCVAVVLMAGGWQLCAAHYESSHDEPSTHTSNQNIAVAGPTDNNKDSAVGSSGGDLSSCSSDSDCIPKPSECHPHTCINKKFKNQFDAAVVCTMLFDCSAAYKPSDCVCRSGACTNKNEGKSCE